MAQSFTPGLAVKRHTAVRKMRELPVPGVTLKKVGDAVKSGDIIARAELPGEMHILRIAESMGLTVDEVLNGLRIREGDTVTRGQIICEHKGIFGLFTSRFQAPDKGLIEVISKETAHVCLRLASKVIEVDAYISGKIVSVDEGKSVTVENNAAFIQGIFGVGGERQGSIKVLDLPNDGEVDESSIPAKCVGSVLVGGARPTLAALHRAGSLGAVGLVTGSIDDSVLAAYLGYDLGIALTGDENIPMTVIITEGFGRLAISKRTMELLKELNGKDASINGATQVRAGALRPEIIITSPDLPQSAQADAAVAEVGLIVGGRVRLIRHPYFGLFATITELPHEGQTIESGTVTRVLRAKLESGKEVTVPRANVELVG